MTAIDPDDLALLAKSFDAALADAPGATATQALFDLGWAELLEAAPAAALATAFGALGRTAGCAGLLDDVLAHGLGLAIDPGTAMVLPAPDRWAPPGRRSAGIVVDGMATSRLDQAARAVVVLDGGSAVTVDASLVRGEVPVALDPTRAHRRVQARLDAGAGTPVDAPGTWDAAVAFGRVALAHELLAGARTMLDQARSHALDRVQFSRPVASFQAVRHRLAEALVAIEGAEAVVEAAGDVPDPLLATLAKSLAGQAARTTATHAQQVLAGIGFTTDHPFHRWLKRTLVLDVVLGSSSTLPGEVGAELLRRGDAPRLLDLEDVR